MLYYIYMLFGVILATTAANLPVLLHFSELNVWLKVAAYIAGAVLLILIAIVPPKPKGGAIKRLKTLSGGFSLILIFLTSLVISVAAAVCIYTMLAPDAVSYKLLALNCGISVIALAVVFWAGIIRVFLTSVQLGIKWRVIAVIFGFIVPINLVILLIMCEITITEYRVDNKLMQKYATDREKQNCATKYPILFVHGVFFRDSHILNYWGRIPSALKMNGARIYYGEQQSAASIDESAHELAIKIRGIIELTGCEKVNIIAHSKGGLDSRCAITKYGMAPYVASLTTINTPHRGCVFVDSLLNEAPDAIRKRIAATYNKAFNALGDSSPDFISSVRGLTKSECDIFNDITPDMPEVFYQSVGSRATHARSGRFPLNVSYPLVKHYDGDNDGLVAVESMRWGESFTFIDTKGRRGVTHADMIDLNRENIKGFDVRDFYVTLVSDLRKRGF